MGVFEWLVLTLLGIIVLLEAVRVGLALAGAIIRPIETKGEQKWVHQKISRQ